jgi:hypothetical protein
MSKNEIENIQQFLTVVNEDENKRYQIVNVQLLLNRHSPGSVIRFLTELHKDYTRKLQRVLRKDRTSSKIDQIIAAKWRVKMAINAIKNTVNEGGRAR